MNINYCYGNVNGLARLRGEMGSKKKEGKIMIQIIFNGLTILDH